MLSPARPFQCDEDLLSSAEKCRRVARRMSLIASSAGCFSRLRISVSSSLLAATMIQKSSLDENRALSQRALMAEKELPATMRETP